MLQDVDGRDRPGHGASEWVEMGGYERQQLYGALILLVTALFVASGSMPAWRRPLRIAAIGFFLLALAIALIDIVVWLAELGP